MLDGGKDALCERRSPRLRKSIGAVGLLDPVQEAISLNPTASPMSQVGCHHINAAQGTSQNRDSNANMAKSCRLLRV